MAYDSRCYDLAAAILKEAPQINDEDRRQDLAQDIQDEIEAWLACELSTEEVAARLKKKKPLDPNIIYPGKDLTNTFPEET